MIQERTLSNLPESTIPPDISENIKVLSDVQKICEALLNPESRIFRHRSHRAQKKILRDFYDRNDILAEHDASITKLLSLEVLKKWFLGWEKSIIKKWFLLAKHYLDRTGEFDPRYFSEILSWAREFLQTLPDEEEEISHMIVDGVDFLFWKAQKIIDGKKNTLNEQEKKFFWLAGDFYMQLEWDYTSASEYYEAWIQLWDDMCHAPFCELLENAEDIQAAISILQTWWEKYKDIHYIESLIALRFRAWDDREAYKLYNTYSSIIPNPDPVYAFKKELSIADISSLDDMITLYHTEPGEHILGKELEKQVHTTSIRELSRNARILQYLWENSELQKEHGFEEEYMRLSMEQLLLLHRSIFWYLDFTMIGSYLHYIDEFSQTPGGYEFLYNFFESHPVPHVMKLVEFFEKQRAKEEGEEYESEPQTFAAVFVDHIQFILQHIGTSHVHTGTFEKIRKILSQLQIHDEEMIEAIDTEEASYKHTRGTLNNIPIEIRSNFLSFQRKVYEKYGEMFLRKIEYIVQFQHGAIPHQNDTDLMIYSLMLGCLFINDTAIDSSIQALQKQWIDDTQAQAIWLFANEYGLNDLAISMLTETCHPDDPDILEHICKLWLHNPERIMEIYTNFAANLDELSYQWESYNFLYFLEEIENEVRLHSRDDITLPRMLKILGLAHWMEACNLQTLSRWKDSEKEERAIFHREKAERHFSDSLEFSTKFLKEEKIQTDPIVHKFTKNEFEWTVYEYAQFLRDSWKYIESFQLLSETFKNTDSIQILTLLASTAIEWGIYIQARPFLIQLDEMGRVEEATELWIEYHFRWDANERLKAVQLLWGSDQEILDKLNPKLYDGIKEYALCRFELLHKRKEYLSQDEANEYLHLLRYQAITFGTNIELAVTYWQELRRRIKEWNMNDLNIHFLKYVHPEELVVIKSSIDDATKMAHTLLINVRHESHMFYEVLSKKFDTTKLMFEVMETFKEVPNGIWYGFTEDWTQERYDIELKEVQKKYGTERVPMNTNYRLQ